MNYVDGEGREYVISKTEQGDQLFGERSDLRMRCRIPRNITKRRDAYLLGDEVEMPDEGSIVSLYTPKPKRGNRVSKGNAERDSFFGRYVIIETVYNFGISKNSGTVFLRKVN